jgi:ABC-type histidine transport system ATPase subunit
MTDCPIQDVHKSFGSFTSHPGSSMRHTTGQVVVSCGPSVVVKHDAPLYHVLRRLSAGISSLTGISVKETTAIKEAPTVNGNGISAI